VWAIAIDAVEDGAWRRTTLPTAQLYQPGPREVGWTADFSAGPEEFRFKADFTQRSSGVITVLGQPHPGWLEEGTVRFDEATTYKEVDTYAEGIGGVSFSTFFQDGGQRSDLRSFGADLPILNGRWIGTLEDKELELEIGPDGASIAFDRAQATAVDAWTVSGTDVAFTVSDGARQAFRLSLKPWGLVGTVARPGGQGEVLELRRDDRPPPDPTPVPDSSVVVPGA
ncbi:MAG: hypothetical protein ACJ767_09540, partial [Chloroflexota bacterium]